MVVVVLVEAVGQLSLRVGMRPHPLEDGMDRQPEQPAGVVGEITD